MNKRQRKKQWDLSLKNAKNSDYQTRTIFYAKQACCFLKKAEQEGKSETEIFEELENLRKELNL